MKGIFTLVCLVFIKKSECACTFPSSLVGTWVTGGQGTWIVNSTHIQDFKTISDSGRQVTGITPFTTLTFECHETMGDTKYVIKSETFELFVNAFVSLYICLDLREISTEKYVFYKATEEDINGDQFTLISTYADVCNSVTYELAYRYRVALKSGSETTALIQCPSAIFGTYTYDTCTDPGSNTTSMDVCDSRQQLIHNYTLCNTTQMFSAEGLLDCVYFQSSGSVTYLTVYNRDNAAPDDVSYFRFTCLALALSGNDVLMTVYPERCLDNQNTSAIASPGYAVHFTPFYLCPITSEESSSTNILPYIIGAIAALLLIALIILLIYCCCCRRRKKKKKDDEESVNESDSESEASMSRPSSRHESRRSSRDSSKSSVDSGIDGLSPHPNEEIEEDDEGQQKVTEVVLVSEGEKEIEDKTSRPASRQNSRMSDLPPSTIPPEDEEKFLGSPEEEQVENEDTKSVNEEETVEEDKQSKTDEAQPHEPPDEEQDNVEGESQAETDETTSEAQEEEDDSDEDDSQTEMEEKHSEDPKEDQDEEKTDYDHGEIEDNAEHQSENESEANEKESEEDVSPKKDDEAGQESEHEIQDEQEEKRSVVSDNKSENEQMEAEEQQETVDNENDKEPSETAGSDVDEDNQSKSRAEEESDKNNTESNGDAGLKSIVAPVPVGDPPSRHDKDQEEDDRGLDNRKQRDVKNDDSEEDDRQPGEERRAEQRKTDDDGHHSSDSEYQRKFRNVGIKEGTNYMPSGYLTTVLVSRHDEEKKRMKLRAKTKKQHMTKLARNRTRKLGGKGDKLAREEDVMTSDDEFQEYGMSGNTRFMQQYRNKKRIEHILDEQHYWSDPEDDQDRIRSLPSESSLLSSEYDDSEYEIVVGDDRVARRVRKSDIAKDHERQRDRKMQQMNGCSDNLVHVEQPENINESDSKKKIQGLGNDVTVSKDDKVKAGDKQDLVNDPHQDKNNVQKSGGNTKLINVKETPAFVNGNDMRYGRSGRGKGVGTNDDILSDFCDTELGKISDEDSGLSDEEEAVDVILSDEQQQMIVNMLFDEEMNLRPQFDRDEAGRIVRRLDNSVIYDPHTGRFTYIKRLGQLFKVARLKRNAKGRPTGGYIEDEYGPREEVMSVKTDSVKRGRITSSKGSSYMDSKSPSADQKRSRPIEGKNVGFVIPEDDVESMSTDQLEYNKRGRRDIGSSIRKTLSKRLFRKKRKRVTQDATSLPDVQLKRAWTGDSMSLAPGGGDMIVAAPGGVSPLFVRSSGRFGTNVGTPGQQRRMTGSNDPEQLQRYREGLQSDKRILENLQDKLNSESDDEEPVTESRPWETRLAFIDSNGQGDTDGDLEAHEDLAIPHSHEHEHTGHGSQFYRTSDGRLVIRERGCPELKPQTQQQQRGQLFTIVRRPEDLEKEDRDREERTGNYRNIRTAPVIMQSVDSSPRDQAHAQNSQDSLDVRGSGGSQMTSIDDNRLRRLLEELYKDKKYFDNYIDRTEPKSEAIVLSKGLAEHGRGYLLERADYWERRGPLPPRPPQTAVGWRMMRQQTMWSTREGQMQRASTTMTYTPTEESLPGTIDSPRNDEQERNKVKHVHENSNGEIDNDDKMTSDSRSPALKESEA